MQKIKYINPLGTELVISRTPPYIFEKVEGIHSEGTQMLTTSAPGQDGKSLHDMRIEDREITVWFNIRGDDLKDMYTRRQSAIALTSSVLHRGGKLGRLEYTNDAGSWQIPCVVKIGVTADKRNHNYNHCSVVFYCPDPFWRSLTPDVQNLAYLDGGLEFPLNLDSAAAVQFGAQGYQNSIYNYGDVPAPVQITITGPATEPQVIKQSTGEFVRVRKALAAGDKLYINTDRDNCEVTITYSGGVSESAFGYIDPTSTMFHIDPGENALEYQSGDDTTTARIEVEAYSQYGGV